MATSKETQLQTLTSERRKSIVNIIFTYNWVTDRLRKILERGDLSLQQYNILQILRDSEEPLSTLDIRELMPDQMSDTSRIVDRMLLKGLVKKNANKIDKRLVAITISAKGRKALEKIEKYDDEMEGILRSISVTEAKTLNKCLHKIRRSN